MIGGAWVSCASTAGMSIDPASEKELGSYGLASPAEVDAAVGAARRAFEAEGWRAAPKALRLETLRAIIQRLEAKAEDLAQEISQEIGAPIDFARARQVAHGLDHLRIILAAAEAARDDVAPDPTTPEHRVRYEPMGVAALITPWNWPFNQIALKVGAALAAGCAMVLKPSELAPSSAALIAEEVRAGLAAAGAPAGVFNLVQGEAASGRALVAHPGVDAISFTGSTAAGREIAQIAARDFKRVTLELGGKSPNLLFADCDAPRAVRQGVAHCFRNAGQSCNAASRMLVERSIYDEVLALAAAEAEATTVGDPAAPGGHLGPQVSGAQFDRVQALIASGIEQGARLIAGGLGKPPGLPRGVYGEGIGYFSRPTVFADVAPSMRIFREEIFGPVLTITPFDSEDEAIALANDSAYGLAAYVQTGDPARADRLARALRAGMVQVNGESRAPGAPFGGVKASGVGREAGFWGVRAFQEIKAISGVAAR
ncbi:MAG: aldehyde dehydrogenase family protein [Pseudomonadota bacterium]